MSDTELQNLDDSVGLGFCSYLDITAPLILPHEKETLF